MKKNPYAMLFSVFIAILTAGCQSQTATPPAVKALETYLKALVQKDEATLVSLSCADWEASALLEFDAFQSVETSLEGLSCQQDVAADGSVNVNCQGAIVTSYGSETQRFDLSKRTYKMVEQGGDWLVCGY